MNDETFFSVLAILSVINLLCAVGIGLAKRSVGWGVACLFLGPVLVFFLIIAAVGFGGRTRMLDPRPRYYQRDSRGNYHGRY